ncbi:hypothetical protein V6N12_014602 [Hibiscus sabdariffa]|uniref:Uncharacterized protein n=1 Tax=Hibiscus sabdariffa TaxID=183260 RepID=A0ABR2DKN8_9ROSI
MQKCKLPVWENECEDRGREEGGRRAVFPKIQHVLRAGKLVADMLAKEAVHTHFETHIVEYPDGLLKVLLWSDLNANVE